jgi:diguanylate cyclase (GGDEF)-like protein
MMAAHQQSPTSDAFEHELRIRSVVVGTLLTAAAVVIVTLYSVLTWGRPHRSLILGLLIGALVLSVIVTLMPTDRLVRSRWREPFFLWWSFMCVAVVAAAVVLDGTDESPLSLIFILPLIFAANSYPVWSMLAVAVADVGTCLAVGLSDGGADVSRALVLTGLLGAAAAMCALQARDHERQREALELVSRTDPLTGVLNRRGFEERLGSAMRMAERSAEPVALLLLDLDGFKPVNDRDGHAAGDLLLQWVAHRIAACVRPGDVVGRIGGDEFAVVAPGVGAREAAELAARIVRTLEERIGASIGVADYPSDGTTTDDLHRRADEGLYSAKRGKHARLPPHLSPAIPLVRGTAAAAG